MELIRAKGEKTGSAVALTRSKGIAISGINRIQHAGWVPPSRRLLYQLLKNIQVKVLQGESVDLDRT